MPVLKPFSSTGTERIVRVTNDAGEPIAVSCKVCGSFTLDTESCLCASCSLIRFIKDFWRLDR